MSRIRAFWSRFYSDLIQILLRYRSQKMTVKASASSSPPAAPHPSGKAVMHSPSPSQFSHQPSLLASSVTQFLEAGWSIVNNVQHSYLAAALHAFLRHCSAKACSLIEGLKVLYQEHKRFLVHASANQVTM